MFFSEILVTCYALRMCLMENWKPYVWKGIRLHGQGMKEGISEICICGGENRELRLPMKRQILEEGLGSFVPQCCWSASLLVTDAI